VYHLIRPLLFSLDPELAHRLTLSGLKKMYKLGLIKKLVQVPKQNEKTVMGLKFSNPIGLAAGLDKDGHCIDALAALGFGFIEVGTVTPRPQRGNVHPRLFRLPEVSGIINRMGFNNEGVDVFVENVRKSVFYQDKLGILGLNIGKNADTQIDKAVDDYVFCLKKVYPYASYVAVNISSPNTKNLRQLQELDALNQLLDALKDTHSRLLEKHQRYVPLALKIAPDVDEEQIKVIAELLLKHKIDGVIATNTTLSREGLAGVEHAEEAGGLSGMPVRNLSTLTIRRLKAELGDAIPIIAVGGILSGNDAKEKIQAGASLVQLYTGLIYRGPDLISECAKALE
jgi:dihydroorotate dehydrogenase